MRKPILGLVAIAAIAVPLAFASSANAATLDATTGAGFVGKGEVQSAFGWNNAKMQGATATGFTFSTTQSATQALTQDASQVVTQDAHTDITRTVSCFIDGKKVDHTAFGTRDGSRTGVRNGERTGTLHGSLKGSLDLHRRVRQQGQDRPVDRLLPHELRAGLPRVLARPRPRSGTPRPRTVTWTTATP